jgi:hypothetical protein
LRADSIELPGAGPISMRFSRAVTLPRFHEKRRGVRLNSRVPVAIEWENGADGTLREEATTRVVSPYGCLLVLPQDLAMEQRLQVRNVATQESIPGIVVWKGNQGSEGWELGIELVQPPEDFWGFEL